MKRFGSALFVLLATRASFAEGVDRKVEIVIAASPSDASLLEGLMRAGLSRTGVAIQTSRAERLDVREVVTPASSTRPAAVRVWFDLQTPGQAVIYMADEAWERVLVRRMSLPNGLDEVGREALTFVLKSSVEAMLRGAQIGVSREEAKEIIGEEATSRDGVARDRPDEKSPAAAETGGPPTFAFGLAYEVQGYAKAAPIAHGPAVLLALGDRGFHHAAWLTGTYRTPAELETDSVDVHMTSFGFRGGFTFNPRLGATAWLSAGAWAGVDWYKAEPRIKEGVEVQSISVVTSVSPSVRPVVGLGFSVGQALLLLQLGLDLDLSRTRYVVQTDGVGSYVLSPWAVRPVATFSMLLGTQSFEPAPR
jgi:hypothetical protein